MKIFQNTPLAWNNLTHRPRRLAVALAGVGFGVLLMFMETGFRNALFDSTVQVIRALDADIIVVSRARYTLTASQNFDLSRVHMARTCRGVQSANPLYIETFYSVWRRPGQKGYPIRVFAFDLKDPVFSFPEIAETRQRLDGLRTALIDVKSRSKFGFPNSRDRLTGWQGAELTDQSLRLVGGFHLGTDFANDGNLIMSAGNFKRFFRHRGRGARPLQNVDIGVVRIENGADAQATKNTLRRVLPNDVSIFTRQEFIDREISFWNKSTPIGFIFMVGTVMGFIIGAIICYQIIYATNADYISEFATLKAMGYRPRYFIGLVLRQSIYLALLGFLPGLVVSLLLYFVLSQATGLLMALTLKRIVIVLLLTIAMCSISGALAMRRVLDSDPAELF